MARRSRATDDPEILAELADRMTLTGMAMGVAGRTAPLSGTEHLISHLLDMAAGRTDVATGVPRRPGRGRVRGRRPIWHDLLDRLDPSALLR